MSLKEEILQIGILSDFVGLTELTLLLLCLELLEGKSTDAGIRLFL